MAAPMPVQTIPQSLVGLPESEELLVEHASFFAVGHLGHGLVALCGATVTWPIAAGHLLRAFSGRLCPACAERWIK